MPDSPTGPGKNVIEQVRRAQQNHLAQDTLDTPQQQYLTFRLNAEWYGLSVYQLVEVLPIPKITRVPSVPDHILGVMNFRGEVLSAVDLKKLFGLAQSESTADQAIVVVEQGEMQTGLLVDEIGDLIELAPDDLSEEAITAGELQRVFFEGATHWGDILLSIIKLEGIFGSKDMYSERG
ncbi:MAG: purine-binding chemotaxis protein CheW [Deltaproteobacteria bacterium]|nr:MAG: purine-binding chemotaxis protein CheW [Deltaproteobacteria bacterium]